MKALTLNTHAWMEEEPEVKLNQIADFISKEEFQVEAGVSKTVMAALSDLGALGDLPDTNQISMF